MAVISFEELAGFLAGDKDFLIELGEQTGIGSSSLLVRKSGKTILIDRGLAFEGNGVNKITTYPAGNNLEGIHIDMMVFTHVHADHTGLIVPTVLNHPEAKVVISKKTLEELEIVLADTVKNQRKETSKAIRNDLPMPEFPFDEFDVHSFWRLANDCYEVIDIDGDENDIWITWKDWPGWDFGFTFSGHTKGSFITLVKDPSGDGMVFTGDVCSHDQETTNGVAGFNDEFLDEAGFRACRRIIYVTEATNGKRSREFSQEDMDFRLSTELEAVRERGGTALFPVFSINRGPNMVVKLVRLGFNVLVAGMVRQTIRAEIDEALLNKWIADGKVMLLQDGATRRERENNFDAAARNAYGFRPIITSSATLDQGASVAFASRILPERKNLLVSTGHRFDGSAMKEIFELNNRPVELGRTLNLNVYESGKFIKKPVNAKCQTSHFDYSAHDYREGLVNRVVQLRPDIVFVKHCIESGFEGFRTALQEKMMSDICPIINWARHLHLFEI